MLQTYRYSPDARGGAVEDPPVAPRPFVCPSLGDGDCVAHHVGIPSCEIGDGETARILIRVVVVEHQGCASGAGSTADEPLDGLLPVRPPGLARLHHPALTKEAGDRGTGPVV